LRLTQLSMRSARFQRGNAPAQILQNNPESLQGRLGGIARAAVMLRLANLHARFDMTSFGLVFSRTITRPMYELIGRAARIARGDRDAFQPLKHYGTREFAQLSRSFLDMAGQLSRRSDYIATFSAHLTHELKSPLTSIKGAAELLLESLQSKTDTLTRMEQKNFVSNILGDTERLDAMTQRLRELARAEGAPQNEQTELSTVVSGLRSRFPTLT